MNTNPYYVNPRVASVCLECGERHRGYPKRTFLGFQKITCEGCGQQSLFPLTKGYVAIYWVAIVVITGVCIRFLLEGAIPIPGVLFFAGIYGLWRDRQICQSIVNNPPRGPEVPDQVDDASQQGDYRGG